MKVRKGFVSNSSSSSFICDGCGSVKTGWDLDLEEAEMTECDVGHYFCNEHLIDFFNKLDKVKICNEIIKMYQELIDEWLEEKQITEDSDTYHNLTNKIILFKGFRDEGVSVKKITKELHDIMYAQDYIVSIPSTLCPVCQRFNISEHDFSSWLIKRTGKKKEELEKEFQLEVKDENQKWVCE